MNRLRTLHNTPEFTIVKFDHPTHEPHADPQSESASDFSVSLVDHGEFSFIQSKQEHHLRTGDLLLMYPGLCFRVRHQHHFPQDSGVTLSIRFPSSKAARKLAQRIRNAPVRKAATRSAFLLRRAA